MGGVAAATVLKESKAFQAILWGGLIAGALDITAAFATWGIRGVAPVRILQGIASGLLGPKAFHGGAGTAVLGAALHFFIATTATAVYYAASRKLLFMTQQAIPCGMLYGVLVYVFMNLVVLPLSAIAKRPFTTSGVLIGLAVHIVCVGLPIALTVRRYSR